MTSTASDQTRPCKGNLLGTSVSQPLKRGPRGLQYLRPTDSSCSSVRRTFSKSYESQPPSNAARPSAIDSSVIAQTLRRVATWSHVRPWRDGFAPLSPPRRTMEYPPGSCFFENNTAKVNCTASHFHLLRDRLKVLVNPFTKLRMPPEFAGLS